MSKQEVYGEVIIDSREKHKDLFLKDLQGFKTVTARIETLPVGDFWVEGGNKLYVVERKEISDLIGSSHDGRLWVQLANMKDLEHSGDKTIEIEPRLVWEGLPTIETKFKHTTPQEIVGTIQSVAESWNIPVLYSATRFYTVLHLVGLAKIAGKVKEHRLFPQDVKVKAKTPSEEVIRTVESFPKVGPTQARKLLLKFGNIFHIVTASPQHLAQAVGPSLAENVSRTVHYRPDIKELES